MNRFDTMETLHLTIKGKVQGVYYRASAKEKGDEINIKGWVKNKMDGNVEAVASGSKEQIEQFIEWCKKGPKRAMVTEVEVTPLEYQSFPDFKIVK